MPTLANCSGAPLSINGDQAWVVGMADRPATTATVAVSSKTLQNCKDAAKVCRGADILRHRGTIGGIKAAKDFVSKNEEEFKHMPVISWSELKQMAAQIGKDSWVGGFAWI